jgi:competence protein ComEC
LPRDNRVRIIGVVGLVAVALWLSVMLNAPRNLQITFLDVGDGLCAVVRTPGGHTLLMDCGTSSWGDHNAEVGSKLVAPYLQRLGLNSIDVAILSHPHADHDCGFAGLFKAEPAELVLDCGARCRQPEYKAFVKAVKDTHARFRVARRGQEIDMGDGVRARILNPLPDVRYPNLNDRSIVLRVTYKKVAVLLTADASDEAEQEMLRAGLNVRAQVLQVGHHGSRQASSSQWLAAVRPQIAVISCARRSQYHFPSRLVLDRLRGCGARTYTTGQSGAVTITTDGEAIRVDTVRNP